MCTRYNCDEFLFEQNSAFGSDESAARFDNLDAIFMAGD